MKRRCPVECPNNEEGYCALHDALCGDVRRYCDYDETPPPAVKRRDWQIQDYMDAAATRKYHNEAPDILTQDPTVDDRYDTYDDI